MTVALPTAPAAESVAHRPDECALCREEIENFQPIKLASAPLGWCHAECAEEFWEVYPEKRPKDDGPGW